MEPCCEYYVDREKIAPFTDPKKLSFVYFLITTMANLIMINLLLIHFVFHIEIQNFFIYSVIYLGSPVLAAAMWILAIYLYYIKGKNIRIGNIVYVYINSKGEEHCHASMPDANNGPNVVLQLRVGGENKENIVWIRGPAEHGYEYKPSDNWKLKNWDGIRWLLVDKFCDHISGSPPALKNLETIILYFDSVSEIYEVAFRTTVKI